MIDLRRIYKEIPDVGGRNEKKAARVRANFREVEREMGRAIFMRCVQVKKGSFFYFHSQSNPISNWINVGVIVIIIIDLIWWKNKQIKEG